MFSDNKKQTKQGPMANNSRNLVGITSKITGDITSEGDFRIDGTLEGSLDTNGKVVVGKNGKIVGNLTCKSADIEGHVNGSINCKELLSLKATSIVEGEVFIEKLEIEPGAVFNVSCNMKGIKALNNDAKKTEESRITAS